MKLQDIKKPKLYSMREAAAVMEISYTTIQRMVSAGRIAAVNTAKSGNKAIWGISAEAIQYYYDSISHPNNRSKAKHE